MGLTFEVLRTANVAREGSYPSGEWTPAQWLQALVGEVGEYANLRKKFERGDFAQEHFQVEAAKELADIQTYLDKLAGALAIDLGAATIAKFNEVSCRIRSCVRIDSSGGHVYSLGVLA